MKGERENGFPADPETASETDPFLARWSRRKQESREGGQGEQAPLLAPGQEQEGRADADLPAPESLEDDADFAAFLAPGVSDGLRRRALKRLFASPGFNVTDGLDDYAEDFSGFEALGELVTHEMRRMMESDPLAHPPEEGTGREAAESPRSLTENDPDAEEPEEGDGESS